MFLHYVQKYQTYITNGFVVNTDNQQGFFFCQLKLSSYHHRLARIEKTTLDFPLVDTNINLSLGSFRYSLIHA